jgi:hypothetical protein
MFQKPRPTTTEAGARPTAAQTKEDQEDIWWARKDLNLGPMDYESTALTAELRARRDSI